MSFVARFLALTALVFLLRETPAAEPRVLSVFAVYVTPVEEPWNAVIHRALLAARDKGQVRYTWQDKVKGEDLDKVVRGSFAKAAPDIFVGDASEKLEVVQRLAADFQKVAFVVGASEGVRKPNLSIFDDTLQEPAYLCGLIAGKMTRSNVLGVVAGIAEPDSNRNIHAFIKGARDANAKVKVKVTFIDSWYDPPRARKAALAQIDAGADLLYAERDGVIEAAKDKKVLAFGNMIDQNSQAPDTVITGPVWNMTPVVQHVIAQVAAGKYEAQELRGFSTMAKGGTLLADWHGWDRKLPPEVVRLVKERQAAIKDGTFKVEVKADRPRGD